MTDWSYDPCDPVFTDRPSLSRRIFVRTLPVLGAFSFSALVALRLAGGLAEEAYAPVPAPAPAPAFAAEAEAAAVAPVARQAAELKQAANPYGALFDPDGSLVGVPAIYAQNEPVGPSFSPYQSEPLFVMADPPESALEVAQNHALAEPAPQVAEQTPAQPQEQAAQPQVADQRVAQEQVAEAEPGAPVPPARPAELSIQPRVAEVVAPPHVGVNATPRPLPSRASARERAQTTTLSQNDPRNFFEKLFSGNSDQKGPQLAYASPDGGALNMLRGATSSPSPVTASGGTAVYDISAHTVYLPNGQALEAHSGLGPYKDDPGHVQMRMRGSTPPAVYNLTLRESLFHGVQALRLTPVSGSVYGRGGLLAHTFMLGPNGDSNGCVSFRNYRAFLQAYMSGVVRRLVVVSRRS